MIKVGWGWGIMFGWVLSRGWHASLVGLDIAHALKVVHKTSKNIFLSIILIYALQKMFYNDNKWPIWNQMPHFTPQTLFWGFVGIWKSRKKGNMILFDKVRCKRWQICPKTRVRAQYISKTQRMGTTKLIFLTFCSGCGLPVVVYLSVCSFVVTTERQDKKGAL